MKLMLKWPGLHYSTSAFAPKHYPKAIIDYANTRGADKIIYAGYFPMGLSLERIMTEMPNVAVQGRGVAQVPPRQRAAGARPRLTSVSTDQSALGGRRDELIALHIAISGGPMEPVADPLVPGGLPRSGTSTTPT